MTDSIDIGEWALACGPETKQGDRIKLVDKDNTFGGCADPKLLRKNKVYIVEKVEVHSWHTKLKLTGIDGMFNSCCFVPK